jgi:small GTP-binding protein
VAGSKDVGKTSLIHRFVNGRFLINTLSTIGVDFMSKNLTVDEHEVHLSLWDFAGEQKFRTLFPAYCSGASGALVLFDLSSRSSFDDLNDWVSLIDGNTINKKIIKVLIGSKADLADQRQISEQEAKEFAEKHNFSLFLECSAKTGQNVDNIFSDLTRDIIQSSLVRCEKCSELNPKGQLFCQYCGAKLAQ